ncbi:MAG: 2-hydroxyacyl-CoA dehydratase [Deltaproteobacteria bacterium]|nr:2-hydroxyacyl-CoA dehydratase [Deltaproteobacteria bacterium]MBW2303762.1 2-hydroxyacyl-CoA dehydratase [Deltaproteobacteria bacterium]
MNAKNSVISSKIDILYRDYGQRARELAKEGEKLIGYVCSFVPVEMITAAGCIPFRIRGDVHEPITKGDTLLETIVCPFIRSCFDLALKGRYDLLSGIAIPHGCDSMTRSYSTWSYGLELPYSYFINIPSVVKESSLEFFQEELKAFKKSLEDFVGHEITEEDLSGAVHLHNEYRDKVRRLYEFRKPDPPMITGLELTKVLTVGTSLPVEEANRLLDEVLAELEGREKPPTGKRPRILIDGACIDNVELVRILEESGANVVADAVCNGARDTFPRTDETTDPIAALAERYLVKINCPKTYRENKAGTFEGDIADRFGDIGKYAADYHVEGAVLFVYKYCDPFGFEVPARKVYYETIQVPMLYVEDLYSSGSIGQLKTRIQAFLEMIA